MIPRHDTPPGDAEPRRTTPDERQSRYCPCPYGSNQPRKPTDYSKAPMRASKQSVFFNRDLAVKIGGIGACGRPTCCSCWLKNPTSIKTSMRMAKSQNIPLDPEAILGFCQQIKCCVAFEHGTPESVVKHAKPLSPPPIPPIRISKMKPSDIPDENGGQGGETDNEAQNGQEGKQ